MERGTPDLPESTKAVLELAAAGNAAGRPGMAVLESEHEERYYRERVAHYRRELEAAKAPKAPPRAAPRAPRRPNGSSGAPRATTSSSRGGDGGDDGPSDLDDEPGAAVDLAVAS